MFIKSDMFDKLLCCRRKVIEDDDDDRVVEEVVLQHTNNNKTEYISSAQLVERLKGGTTAVVALVREKRLVVAWLGDSQALLVRRRNPVRMVEPHKPELPVERERVEEMGGCVINIQGTWRVLGQLAVSRAIGDADYKPYVSSECDIKSLEIEGDEDFLILACDGLWDTLSAEDAVNVVYAYLTHNNGDTDGVGRCLVEAARSTGSEDNITAVVVFLRPVSTLMEEEAQRIAQGQVPDDVPAVLMEKDSTPSSINAIFSPPIFTSPFNNQFEQNEISKHMNMDEEFANSEKIRQEIQNDLSAPLDVSFKDQDESLLDSTKSSVVPPHDSDSDEGIAVGNEGAPSTQPTLSVHDAPTPTAEEVDAALAELDSIPDGVCESGEVEEEEEDEEEWSYYRMEPQTHPQGEDVITSGGAPAAVSSKPAEDIEIISEPTDIVLDQVIVPAEEPKAKTEDLVADLIEESTDLTEQPEKNELVENIDEIPVTVGKTPDNLESKMDMDLIPSLDDHPERLINFSGPGLEKTDLIDTGLEQNSPHGSGSPRAPGSPRSVEGFVTSVELNTADESFATNFAVNQAQDGFAGPVMDQSSGPFSVYVSSSPEPTSLDPPTQSVDLLNMTSGLTNGQVDDEHPMNRAEVRDESPVEIVHAQSTVEVVAPPSPVDVSGPETLFTMPDQQVPDSPASVHMPPTDISFVPQPIIEPSAEVPVPVYVDDTPVSEPEIIPDVTQAVSATEDFVTVSKTEMEVEAENITETLVSNVESFVETTRTEVTEANYSMETETSNHMVTDFEAKEELLQLSSPVPPLYSDEKDVISVKSPDFETIPNTGEAFVEERTSPVTTEAVSVSDVAEKDSQIASPEPVKVKTPEPVEAKSPEPVKAKSPEPVEAKSPEPVEAKSPEPLEVKSPEPVEAKSPELIAKSPEAVKSPEPEAVKSPEPAVAKATKAAKTPAKSAGDKAATKATPGKATPSKSTPAKATPKSTTPSSTRTPSTRTPTTRTPLAKSTEKKTPTSKPASPAVASRTAAPRPASTRPASAPTSAKPTVSRTAAPKPATTKPAPAKPSTTRSSVTAPKPTTKAAGTTVPKAGSTTKPTTTRPTSASTTTTKKPLDATKSADKADGKLVNGTARPSSRPGTARPTSTTTAARKPLTSTTKTATKSAAEKETKNTTNQILSTRPSKTASSTTKTAASRTTSATHSTSRTTSKVSESANATKSRVTTTTKTTASKTTGAATKKTMVTKSKTSQAGTKETSVKTKTEAAVIAKAEPLVNGENKIADEETSVEVLEKCAVEDIMQASSEKIIAETMSSEQMVVTTETTEVLVNGDH
ncbi:mucin-5AC-like isoform X4 [Macrobrachium rosenbergii]|uniref:mucin-5AC-like isoform X4 n=1 Tax=Macrobrachium rosenbergii TaxID=79674 RepID=UPI0034D49354